MSKDVFAQTQKTRQASGSSPLIVEVQMNQARQDCWTYTWDREQAQLRLSVLQAGQGELPADLATLRLGDQVEVPVYVLPAQSIAPGTLVPARVLGALQVLLSSEEEDPPFPCAGWILLTVPDLPGSTPPSETLSHLPSSVLMALQTHARTQIFPLPTGPGEIQVRSAEEVAQVLRATRFWLKRARHARAQNRRQATHASDEPAVAWRAVEELTAEQRAQIAQAQTLEQLTPLLQAEQLIRFVPTRFQQALTHLLLDDERLLAFLERPLLRHRAGLLGLQQYRANAGLFLVTDQQVLWVRDFFSPGASAFPEGYIARSVPLARLAAVHLFPAATTSPSGKTLPDQAAPYLRLCLEIASQRGRESLDIAFPDEEISRKALARMMTLLQAFLPRPIPPGARAQDDQRVRRLPVVEAWTPLGAEARRLRGLGGVVRAEIKERLEQHLAESLRQTGEELLVSALVPALETYRSPARLVALTRGALLLIDAPAEKARRHAADSRRVPLQVQRYELAQISSAQLSYSLLGSDLRLYVPGPQGETHQHVVPFQSPAIAWFLPLFTRLRLALSAPFPLSRQ